MSKSIRDFEKMSRRHFDNFVFRHFMKSGDYAAYSRKDIKKLMEKKGFSVISLEKVSGFIFTVTGKKQFF